MIPVAVLLFAGTLFSISPNAPDTTLQLAYDQTIAVPAEGATAAYAIDANVAEAAIDGDTVRIHGRSAGATAVVIVTRSSVRTVRVTVSEPPLLLPSNFRRGLGGAAAQSGTAELRYISNPAEVSTTIEMERAESERTQRLRLMTANAINVEGRSGTAIPFVSYQISTPKRDITIFDQAVMNSPLTLDGAFVRGLHVRDGPWSFHGGVTSIAQFQNAFFSTAPEYTAGITREFRLTADQTLAANVYDFVNAPEDRLVATNGAVVSLLHTYRSPVRNLLLRSEVGVSRNGIAAAGQASRDEPGLHFAANLRYEPPRFPGLAIQNLHGLFGDVDLMRERSERTTIFATALLSDYRLPTLHQRNAGASATVSHKISTHLAAVAGALYSNFHSDQFDLTTFGVPLGFDAAWKHAYAGVRDQPTTDFHGRIANGYSANAGTTWGHVSASGFYRHDVDLPALPTLLTAVPGLQEALERSGIFVASPAQLIALLRDVGLLARLGFTAPLDLRLAPSRDDFGGNVDWFGPHQRLTLSVFRSNTQLVNTEYELNTTSIAYTHSLPSGAELAGFVTWGGIVGQTDHPIVGFLVRQPVAALSRLLPGTRGNISGHVFRDDAATAAYSPAARGLAGVEVVIDETRSTRTDASGYYEFRGVPSGIHRVEVKMPTTERFFLTTDSPAYSDVNKVVNFGVSFVRGAVFGELKNDAGEPIEGVRIDLRDESVHRSAITDDSGAFRFNALPDGVYVVSTAADTYPTGYDLASLPQIRVEVKASEPAPANIVAHALRSIAGTVTSFDEQLHKEVPVAGAKVTIAELGLATQTNTAGKYLFRRIPAGAYTVIATLGDQRQSQHVNVPANPGSVVAEKLMMTNAPPVQTVQRNPVENRQPPLAASPGKPEATVLPATDAEDFRSALALYEQRTGALTPQDRYYYAVALYETGHYAAAKRELADAEPPDTEEARRYEAKIAGAIVWRP
jgi:carboxypeptidase family protein